MGEAPAPWQRGFDLEELRAFAEQFRRRHKAIVFGAFGLTKEREIADALAERRLLWTGPRSAPDAVAIVRRLARPSSRSDYAQREIVLPADSVVVDAIAAGTRPAASSVFRALRERAGARPVWVEIFEEDAVVAASLLELGASYAGTSIKAGSEVKGIYLFGDPALIPPSLPGEERATQTLLARELLSPHRVAALLSEIAIFGETWAQHYSSYNKRKSWTAVALRGYSDDPNFIAKPGEMSRSWKEANPDALAAKARWTPAAEALPRLRKLAEKIAPTADRVRLMRLAGGGELTRHADITDREAGVADGKLLRLHVPLRTAPDVLFRGWNDRGEERAQHFAEGSLFYLDQRKPHCVANGSAVDRIHLVIDAWSTPDLRKRLAEAYRSHGF